MYSSVHAPRIGCCAALGASLLMLSPFGAVAGGFDIEQAQSTYFQGMAMAGTAAGGPSISSMFWNPAAAISAERGLTVESTYSLILGEAELTVLGIGGVAPPPGTEQADIAREAVTGASFAAWRLNDKLVLGVAMTSPWGLGSKPDNDDWAGKPLGATTKVISLNVTPSLAYEIMPGVAVGGGVQIEYFDVLRQTASLPGIGTSNLTGDDIGVGFTLGLNLTPAAGTAIGLGFRSAVRHDIEGRVAIIGLAEAPAEADLEMPEKVTLSLRQAVSPSARLLATAEWINWSRFGVIPAVLGAPFGGLAAGDTIANLDFQWRDGWYFALGGEYDWSRDLTLRAGAAYEISPVDEPTTRPVRVPDSNRWYASLGASYRWSDSLSVDFSYHHVFYENDAPFDRVPDAVLAPQIHFLGTADVSTDVLGIGVKMRIGDPPPVTALK